MIWLALLAAAWLVLAGAFLLYIAGANRHRDEEPHWPMQGIDMVDDSPPLVDIYRPELDGPTEPQP